MKEDHKKSVFPDGASPATKYALETYADVAAIFGPNYRRLIWACLDREDLLSEKGTLPPTFATLAKHDGSEARYLFDYDIERPDGFHRVLGSVLSPHVTSSRHQHPFPEDYYILAGKMYVEGELVTENTYRTEPWRYHQVSTGDEPALMVIVMRTAGAIPKDEQHIYGSPNGRVIFP